MHFRVRAKAGWFQEGLGLALGEGGQPPGEWAGNLLDPAHQEMQEWMVFEISKMACVGAGFQGLFPVPLYSFLRCFHYLQ